MERHSRLVALALREMRSARDRKPAELPALMERFQVAVAANVAASVPDVLAEQDMADDPVARFDPMALAGWASDGRPVASLVTLPGQALAEFDRIVQSELADIARQAAAVEAAVRPSVGYYVRALTLPSCGRCVVLAGRVYRREQAFRRHPRCDCRNSPASQRNAAKLVVDPRKAFAAMSDAERTKAFTKAGAQAIEAGADISQVVNARRGMSTVTEENGRRRLTQNPDGTYTTGEGVWVSKHGNFRGRAAQIMREYGVRGPRLMPETIMQLASTREEQIRLLTRYGYITN